LTVARLYSAYVAKTDSLDRVSLIDLRRRIKSLREADLRALPNEAVAFRFGRIIHQYPFQTRDLVLNGLYRARINDGETPFVRAADLWYPPAEFITRPGRLNRPGQACFYGATMPHTAIYELRPAAGATVTVLIAATKDVLPTLTIAFIGLERCLAPEVGHMTDADMFRRSPGFRRRLGESAYRKWLAIDDYLSEILGQAVPAGEEYRYKPSIALADLLFTAPGLDAINFPSVATSDRGINIALTPACADALFRPAEAWMIRIGDDAIDRETGERLRGITFVQRSREISEDGTISWYGPGEAINQEEILRFTRRRKQTLATMPAPAT